LGHEVLVASRSTVLTPGEGATVAVDLPAVVPDLTLEIFDQAGQLVRSVSLEGQGPGLVDFKWDGLDDSGEPLPEGAYLVSVTGSMNGNSESFETFALARVESVSIAAESGEPLLAVQGQGQLTLDQVREIR
jgi:flagellar basal-body rod modification protein FlgD